MTIGEIEETIHTHLDACVKDLTGYELRYVLDNVITTLQVRLLALTKKLEEDAKEEGDHHL